MQIGFNYTLGSTYPFVRQMAQDGEIDYCELLIDNFLQVPPAELAAAFPCPLGLHIMFSRFLENDQAALEALAQRLRDYIAVLRPLYVSDHVATFTHQGRHLYHLAEVDYRAGYAALRARVQWWQQQLGVRLHLENYPSLLPGGHDAPDCFTRLMDDTGCGLLFDLSNAVCAQRNCGLALDAWLPVAARASHFHVAGYGESMLAPKLALDTHDADLADDTMAWLRALRPLIDAPGHTLTYERDAAIDAAAVRAEVRRLRALFAADPAPADPDRDPDRDLDADLDAD